MNIEIIPYSEKYAADTVRIWNQIVEDGVAYPQEEFLDEVAGNRFFLSQDYTGLAIDHDSDRVLGLYILHPNNVGRCGHIANASYAVDRNTRGLHIGEKLVSDSLLQGSSLGFRILQFNAVVDSNIHARHLYERLGFVLAGTIPQGFRMPDGSYEDIHIYYHRL